MRIWNFPNWHTSVSRKIWTSTICMRKICVLWYIHKKRVKLQWNDFLSELILNRLEVGCLFHISTLKCSAIEIRFNSFFVSSHVLASFFDFPSFVLIDVFEYQLSAQIIQMDNAIVAVWFFCETTTLLLGTISKFGKNHICTCALKLSSKYF